ncbi:uncharacterized protein [Rutidosis leptorrhynchoides]|uniref:uncharacterized protein n=1 Tax=Rutidosis leptorrhynchoides TaxID=125765 RepID=UPI003A9A2D82
MDVFSSGILGIVDGHLSLTLAARRCLQIYSPQILFHLDVFNHETIANKWVNGDWRWIWTREDIGSRNLQSLSSLRDELQTCHVMDREDKWLCSSSTNSLFSVKTIREHIDRALFSSTSMPTVWLKHTPRKVNVFLWRFRLDALSLRWNLSAKGLEINPIICPVCNNGIKLRSHLFFSCNIAAELWANVRVWTCCNMPTFTSWEDIHCWIEGLNKSNMKKDIILVIVVTLLWIIWRFRNGIVFDEPSFTRSSIFDVTRLFSYRWLKNRGHVVSDWSSWLAMPL